MIKLVLTSLVFLLLTGCSTTSPNNTPAVLVKDLSSIHHLDEAANFLMLVSDENKNITDNCGLKPQEALSMLQPLHAMLDEEITKFIDVPNENQMIKCSDDCHCGIYSDLITNPKIKDDLLQKANETAKSKLVQCANKSAKWLCSSNLIKKLKSEIEPVSNGL